jgi:hypothetical protein
MDSVMFSSTKGRGVQNKSLGLIDKKDGDSGLSTLRNVEFVGNVRDNGSKGKSGVGEAADSREIAGESIFLKTLPNLAFNDPIIDSVNGPSTWLLESEVKPPEQDGTGSTPPSAVFALASINGDTTPMLGLEVKPGMGSGTGSGIGSVIALASVNAKFSMHLTGDSLPTSTTWQEGNKRVSDRQISSLADKLTLTEEAAISNFLKENKNENKVLCSNSMLNTKIVKCSFYMD